MEQSGGYLVAEVLKSNKVDTLYTLSGAHIFPVYDGCVKLGIRIVDVRHEQTAGFAAEGHAKLTRSLGVAAATAGPGVTNFLTPCASSFFGGSSVLFLGGRAPAHRWGAGSLQELDHVPIFAPVTKSAATAFATNEISTATQSAAHLAQSAHRGPVFLDIPIDIIFGTAESTNPQPSRETTIDPDADLIRTAARMLSDAGRPVLLAGSDVWWGRAEEALRALGDALNVPIFANGMGRGCVPSDDRLSFSRARSMALRSADVVCVIGAPLDFRLNFGDFGEAKVIHIQDSAEGLAKHGSPALTLSGELATILHALSNQAGNSSGDWIEKMWEEESSRRHEDNAELQSDATPIVPARVYGALRKTLDRDAIVICDGGDFVSFAGRYVDSHSPGSWLDPGPFGTLGTGVGYAMAARIVHPKRQVLLIAGDGAIGFSAMDFDTAVRHELPFVCVVGNNGAWGLEKHPMKMIYGYDVAADLNQKAGYAGVVESLGGAGETVTEPGDLEAALKRGFVSGVPYLINVLIDPAVAYPRSANLV